MKSVILLVSIFLFIYSPSYAQLRIHGTIIDAENQSIAYVSIGIPGTKFGTVSTRTGWFDFIVDDSVMGSDVCFSRMSYATQCVPIRGNSVELTITMTREPLQLPEVTIIPRGSRIDWNRNRPRLVNPGGYMFGMTTKGTQIAQQIPIRQSGWIEAISVNAIVESHDSVLVRVTFYEVLDGDFGPQIPHVERWMTIKKGRHETVLQLKETSFYRNEDVIVHFEFIEAHPAKYGNIFMLASRNSETTSWLRSHQFRKWEVQTKSNFAIGVGIRAD